MSTDPKMHKVHEWAKRTITRDIFATGNELAAARYIMDLPAHIIDADKVREVIDELWREANRRNNLLPNIASNIDHNIGFVDALHWGAARLEALLPAPRPRTLADMTPEERAETQWMQADHVEHGRVIITHPGSTYIYYMKPSGLSGGVSSSGSDRITPLPDLPRMVWPAPESDVSIIAPKIDTSTEHDDPVNMSKDPLPGEAWLIEVLGEQYRAVRNFSEAGCEWSADNDDCGFLFDAAEVTLIRRLVPEQPKRVLTTEEDYREAAIETVSHWGNTVIEKKGPESWFSTSGIYNETSAYLANLGEATVIWEPEA
ncbi:hypothetical protein [Corynebacterium sp. A21]|uniref:hypothetical protein n=1 Tax=Corynebacterium sp. A21 TaxID=3457318 RepID=UPI003FCFF7F9